MRGDRPGEGGPALRPDGRAADLLGARHEEGTGEVHLLDIPLDRARAIGHRVHAHALSLKAAGDRRTMDQLRAGVATDLLTRDGGRKTGRDETVELRVDLTTLAGLDESAGEIPGLGPIPAQIARQIAERNTDRHWRFTVTDGEGNVIDTGILRRRFAAAQRRLIEAKHVTCGCRMPAAECDIDHTHPWAQGGPTSVDNGTPECRHDHRLIHEGRWRHFVIDGRHHWISPLGHRYIKKRPP